MKNIPYYTVLILISIIFSACPYESSFTLCDSDHNFYDGRIKGLWIHQSKYLNIAYDVFEKKNGGLATTGYKYDEKSNEWVKVKSSNLNVTKINNVYFLELSDVELFSKRFALKYSFNGDNEIVLTELSGNFPSTFYSNSTFRQQISENLYSPALYGDSYHFHRETVSDANAAGALLLLGLGALLFGGDGNSSGSGSPCSYSCSSCGGSGGIWRRAIWNLWRLQGTGSISGPCR
ncbi:MAG: hypothetical protein IPP27_02390 [Bacteroidetes bacterium]|nr:hypothetical protein [Bacteroidota bacterium]